MNKIKDAIELLLLQLKEDNKLLQNDIKDISLLLETRLKNKITYKMVANSVIKDNIKCGYPGINIDEHIKEEKDRELIQEYEGGYEE